MIEFSVFAICVITVGVSLVSQLHNNFMSWLLIKHCVSVLNVVFIHKCLVVEIIVNSNFRVDSVSNWLMQFVNNIDYHLLSNQSKFTNMGDKKFRNLNIVLMLTCMIRADNVSPVILKLKVPALVFNLFK